MEIKGATWWRDPKDPDDFRRRDPGALSETSPTLSKAVRMAEEHTIARALGGHRGQGIVLTGGGSLLKNWTSGSGKRRPARFHGR